MGAEQSARKLTIDNKDEIDVIKVSTALVQRLSKKANEINSANTVVSPKSSENNNIPVTSGYPVSYYPQLTLTALEIQQQKEQEFHSQDQYWQKRLENLKESYMKIENIMDKEYKKVVDELYKNDQKNGKIQNTVQPCLGTTEKVLKCYQEHPKEILTCSNLIEEFSNCVDQCRTRVIAARC